MKPKPPDDPNLPGLANFTRRSLTNYVTAVDEEREDTETGVRVLYTEGERVAGVEMRGIADAVPDHQSIRAVVSHLGGVDEDVFDVLIAHVIEANVGLDTPVPIDIDKIVLARGRGLKKKRDEERNKVYSSGISAFARDSVVFAIDAIDNVYIALDPPRLRRGKPVLDFDRVMTITRKTFENADGSGDLVSIEYVFGSWFEAWRNGYVLTPKALIELTGSSGGHLKRLGRHLCQLGDRADQGGSIRRRIADIFAETRRPQEDSKNNPNRLRSRFESDLNMLVTKRVIVSWCYESVDPLPARGWFSVWFDRRICVTLVRANVVVMAGALAK